MQAWRLTLDKSDHIAGTPARQLDCSIAETMVEETPDMRHVVDDGRLSQEALLTQIALEFSCALQQQTQLIVDGVSHVDSWMSWRPAVKTRSVHETSD